MTRALIAVLVILLLPMVAAAQTTQRPLVLERLHNPFVFLAHDDFFVFEPQVNATVQVIPHVGVEVGGGYRLSGPPTRSRIA